MQSDTATRIFERIWTERISGLTTKASDCGANAKGGNGFQPGNQCGKGKGGGLGGGKTESRDGKVKPRGTLRVEIPHVEISGNDLNEAKSIPAPKNKGEIDEYLKRIAKTHVYQKVNALLKDAERSTITKDVRYVSIENNIECCPEKEDILAGRFKFTEERQALHQEIIDHTLTEETKAKYNERPVAVLLIGPPGAGKSSAGNPIINDLGVNFATVNNDEVKGALPEYKGWNAAMVHEESAKIVEDMMMPKAMKEQHHMIVDGVGNTAAKMLKIAKELKDENYEIHLVHVTIPTEKTVNRAWDRFAKSAFRDSHEGPGRYVPVDYVAKNVDQRPTETYKALKESGLVDTWSSYSNDVPRGTKPLPLDRGDKNAKRR